MTTDRNTFPRQTVASNNYRIIAYTGATPGADTNTYVLFDNTTAIEFTRSVNPAVFKDFGRYVLILRNSGAGTLNAYGSHDGVQYFQYFSQAVAISTTNVTPITIPVEPHKYVRVEWVNGGAAQSTWYVAQALDGERGTIGAAESGGGGGTVSVDNFPAVQPVSGTVSVIQGAPAKTDNTTYVVSGDMSADVNGPAITVGPEGRLVVDCSWSATGSPVGIFLLQGLKIAGGASWNDIPNSFSGFSVNPSGTAATCTAAFRDLQGWVQVRVVYRRTSGGTANTSLDIDTRVL